MRHHVRMIAYIVANVLLLAVHRNDGAKIHPSYLRIFGGNFTTIDQVPFLAQLHYHGKFHCGGSIVSERCVLTAAHCVEEGNASDYFVHAGTSFLSEPGEVRAVEAIFMPLDNSIFSNDVAILKLRDPLQGENISIIPLCSSAPPGGENVKVYGWGLTEEYIYPNQVKRTDVQIISRSDCINLFSPYSLSPSVMCASSNGQGSCRGDSGGPLVYKDEVCGIVSSVYKQCAIEGHPGIYTNVDAEYVHKYITTTMQFNC